MRQPHDRQIRPFARLTSRRFGRLTLRWFFNIAPATPLPDGRGWGWVFVTVFVLSSCTDGRYDALLRQADSLLTVKPDSAWTLLSAVDSADIARQRRSTQMRYQLLRAEAQNKAYVPFTTDSVLRRVVLYYDRHGSANQQLKARYLLGCAYRDMHEASLAIITWEEAVERADTLSHDCDYSTLYRVYGQMADLYFRQFLPERQLEAQQKFCFYALLAGDTINYINGHLKKNDAFLLLGDTASVFDNIEHVRRLYLERGLIHEATKIYFTPIRIALEKGQYEKARKMIGILESEKGSGLFDENGNVVPSNIIYYYNKGMYYLGINQLDSAEYSFRRLLPFESNALDTYHGLMSLYKIKGNIDSTFKYSNLHDLALAKHMNQTKIAAIAQVESMYNYSRQEKLAHQQKQKANNIKLILIAIIAVVVIFALVAFYTFQKKREEKRRLMDTYQSTIEELNKARQETRLLQQSLSQKEATQRLLKEKEKQVQDLETVVAKLKEQIGKSVGLMLQQKIEEADIIKKFHFISKSHFELKGDERKLIPAREATSKEWRAMMETIQSSHPDLYLLVRKNCLSDLNCKVCVLSYLGFDTPTIAVLTGSRKGSVSNARIALAKQLFNLKSAHDLNKHLRGI